MPFHQTIDPIDTAVKAIDALLTAIEGAPAAGAIVAYRSAITRHGRQLVEAAGPEALADALARIRADAPDKASAETREKIVLHAWQGIITEKDRAA